MGLWRKRGVEGERREHTGGGKIGQRRVWLEQVGVEVEGEGVLEQGLGEG